MVTFDPQHIAKMTMDVECPWCAGNATIEAARAGMLDALAFTCPTCSIDVAMAPEPIGRLVATAA